MTEQHFAKSQIYKIIFQSHQRRLATDCEYDLYSAFPNTCNPIFISPDDSDYSFLLLKKSQIKIIAVLVRYQFDLIEIIVRQKLLTSKTVKLLDAYPSKQGKKQFYS